MSDATHITDPARYVALLVLALRAMLMLELPHVNVLSKFDLLDEEQQSQLSTYGHSNDQSFPSTTIQKYRTYTTCQITCTPRSL